MPINPEARPITVGIADYAVTNDPKAVLVTYGLGSCIGVMIYDPILRVAGMLHYMLPYAKVNPEKAKVKPAMFADTGLPLLLEEIRGHGCQRHSLQIKVAGGGKLFEAHGIFDIGQRNYRALRKLLWKEHLIISSEDVGGNKSRTARLFVESGLVTISSQGKEWAL